MKLREVLAKIKRAVKTKPEPEPESPEDPCSYVGAPKKPRLPHLSAAASEPLE